MISLEGFAHGPELWCAAAPENESNPVDREGNQPDFRLTPFRIMIVEDEFFISLDLVGMVEALGHVVVATAVTADEAVGLAKKERPDLVLMDIRLNGVRDGIDAAVEIRNSLGIGSIFITANSDPQTRQRAQAAHPLGFLQKPITQERLRLSLKI